MWIVVPNPKVNPNGKSLIDDLAKSERLAFGELSRLEQSIEGAHFVSRHGPQTTLSQQRLRASYGVLPDNPSKVTFPTDSGGWLNSGDMFESLQKAQATHLRTGDPVVIVDFDKIIG